MKTVYQQTTCNIVGAHMHRTECNNDAIRCGCVDKEKTFAPIPFGYRLGLVLRNILVTEETNTEAEMVQIFVFIIFIQTAFMQIASCAHIMYAVS